MITSLLTTLMDSPWWTCRTTKLQGYLYQCKPAPGEALSAQLRRRYVHFCYGQYLLYAAVVQLVLRLLYLTQTDGSLDERRPYNPLVAILLEKYNFVTSVTIVIVGLTLATFVIVIDYLAFFRADHFIYKLGYQLMTENGQGVLTLNKDRLGNRPSWIGYTKTRQWLVQWTQLILAIWQSSDLRFQYSRLDNFPYISRRLRACLAIYSAAIEFTFAGIWIFIAFIVFTLAISFLVMVFDQLTFSALFLLFVDGCLILFSGLNALRTVFFGLHYILLLSFVTHHYIDELNLGLRHSLCQSSLAITRYLDHFYREHNRLLYMAEYTNDSIVSPLFFVLFFTIVSLSIVAISSLLFQQLLPSEEFVMMMYLVVAVAISVLCCRALLEWAQAFYTPERLLFCAQYRLGNRGSPTCFQPLTAKVKLMAFYETICTTNQFHFTLGSLRDISKRSLYEFCFAYSGMVIFVSARIRDAQTETVAN